MSVKNFTPEHIAATVLRDLHANLVAKQICYNAYEGEIKKAGDAVRFPGLSKPTVAAYAGSVTYEDVSDAGITMYIDQDNYYAFKIPSLDEKRANVNIQMDQAREAMYQLQATADSYLMGFYSQLSAAVTDTTLDSTTVLSSIAELEEALANENVPRKNMWMVVPPWIQTKLTLAGIKFQIKNGSNAKDGITFTDDLGFDVYVSTQVVNTGTAGTPISQVMAGSYRAIGYADQMVETNVINPHPDFFGAGVRGRHVFGAKIIRPKEIKLGVFTKAAETAI
jgi:hypothetical protein